MSRTDSFYQDMSEPERVVSEYLRDELGIWWKYEFPIFVYDEKKRPRVWTPDFFLEKLNMYVEVVGSEKNWEDNERNYQYRQQIYKKNKVNVVFIHFWKPDWKDYTAQMTKKIDNARHSEVERLPIEHTVFDEAVYKLENPSSSSRKHEPPRCFGFGRQVDPNNCGRCSQQVRCYSLYTGQ